MNVPVHKLWYQPQQLLKKGILGAIRRYFNYTCSRHTSKNLVYFSDTFLTFLIRKLYPSRSMNVKYLKNCTTERRVNMSYNLRPHTVDDCLGSTRMPYSKPNVISPKFSDAYHKSYAFVNWIDPTHLRHKHIVDFILCASLYHFLKVIIMSGPSLPRIRHPTNVIANIPHQARLVHQCLSYVTA